MSNLPDYVQAAISAYHAPIKAYERMGPEVPPAERQKVWADVEAARAALEEAILRYGAEAVR